MPYTEMDNITPAKLALISERAQKTPKFQFTSLAHLLNEGFLNEWLWQIRSTARLKEWWPTLRAKLRGHYQYYGISGNSRAIERYHYVTKRLVFKWVNRRSQKASFKWKGFEAYLEHYPLPEPRIVHHLYTLSFVS